ncbi:Non-specific lipid transfer protein GPI-anchored 1, partial [Mucuna pruriens]
MKKEENRGGLLGLGLGLGLLVVMVGVMINPARGADDLTTKCSQVIQKVLPCLNFATGKEDKPEEKCCDATTSIKDTNPECLCYIIQQTHKGSSEVKDLGIQEAKLLQLPSACNVKNASITNCPKLLGLPPNSPDAAIFTNASKVTPAAGNSTSTQSENASYGSMVRPSSVIDVVMMGLTIVVVMIPTGFVSIYT